MGLIYFTLVRPRIFRLGATDQELTMVMPGDELIDSPGTEYTHAITIDAPKEIVWDYLIQVVSTGRMV